MIRTEMTEMQMSKRSGRSPVYCKAAPYLADAFDDVFRVGLVQQLAQCQPRARLQTVQLQRALIALSGLHLLALLAEVVAQARERRCLRGAVHTGRVQERFVRVGCILCTLLPALVCDE